MCSVDLWTLLTSAGVEESSNMARMEESRQERVSISTRLASSSAFPSTAWGRERKREMVQGKRDMTGTWWKRRKENTVVYLLGIRNVQAHTKSHDVVMWSIAQGLGLNTLLNSTSLFWASFWFFDLLNSICWWWSRKQNGVIHSKLLYVCRPTRDPGGVDENVIIIIN